MKGPANYVRVAAMIALGLQPGANGRAMRLGTTGSDQSSGLDEPGSPVGDTVDASSSRGLRTGDHQAAITDDAIDVNGGPLSRAKKVLKQRLDWAQIEYDASKGTRHLNNGDRSSAASFHKTLPHDKYGQVDEEAFKALIACVAEGSVATCEKVPAGDKDGFLSQPIGGIAVDMAGPASCALTVPPAPLLDSEDLAAQMAELYWMALTRDVHFSKYGQDETTIAAADNLASMAGFKNMRGVAVDVDGRADPQTQLFRSTAVGVETGPMVSQLLVRDVTFDSITVTPKQMTFAPGADYMADYDDWLFIQNGGDHHTPELVDPVKRYIRSARDLGRLVTSDTIYTEAFRGALVLLEEGAISKAGFNGPYADSYRQKGFVSFGVSHVMKILGSAELAQRSSWYQKWNVHLFARPEAVAGTLHNVLNGDLHQPFHQSLINNSELLERVAARNEDINQGKDGSGRTYLLSQSTRGGSPTHPSYPAGHAVQNGAFATVLKAMVGLERGSECFNDPVFPDDDGLTLLPYTGKDCLTYEGEINKMAFNVAVGRQMCGAHYRMDSEEGLMMGEVISVRMLQQEVAGFPERNGYHFRLFSGETIKIKPDGSFHIAERKCSGKAFLGIAHC